MVFYRARGISLRRTVLLTADVLCLAGSLVVAAYLRLPEHALEYLAANVTVLSASILVFLLVFYAGGMYERQALTRRGSSIQLPLITTALGLVLIILVFYARFELAIGRGILFMAAAFIFLTTCLVRQFYRHAVLRGLLSKNALVVGDGDEVADVVRLIGRTPDSGLRVMGVVSCRVALPGQFVAGVPIVGMLDKLRELAEAFSAETLIVATAMGREPAVLRVLRPLRCTGTEVIDYVGLHEILAQEIPLDHINEEWLMNAALNSSVIHVRKVKRIMDFSVALIGLALSTPLWILAALFVRFSSPGPILYRQDRCGLDASVFTLLKFRTMRHDAEAESGAVWAASNDRRVTRIGAFLRKWRIDEIPQLINVLQGRMSLVGPRPERPEFVETLADAIPYYRERLLVPPGITGWAQVKYPYAASIDAARRKLQYDLYYIKHMGFALDWLILLRTFRTVLIGLSHSESQPLAGVTTPSPERVGEAGRKAPPESAARSA